MKPTGKNNPWLTPSTISLVAANTIPVFGAIFLDWSIFSLMFLFWLENIIIGLLNVVRLIGAVPGDDGVSKGTKVFLMAFQLFSACFFVVHYGGFCLGHGVFVFAIFGKDAGLGVPGGLEDGLKIAYNLLIDQKLILAAISIFISHLFSLCYNYFYKNERFGADLQQTMMRPYGRIIVLHITIILGAIPVMMLGSPIWALVLLVVLKTGVDLKAHIKERARMGPKDNLNSQQRTAGAKRRLA